MKLTIPLFKPSIALGFALLLLTGCVTSLQQYKSALSTYNQAAEQENKRKVALLSNITNDAVATTPTAKELETYQSAYKQIGELLANNKKVTQLKKDGLYGSAMSVKAICAWKLSKYDSAQKTAKQALAALQSGDHNKTVIDYPRDVAMMTAIPGVIKIDQAYSRISKTADNTPYREIQNLIDSGIKDLDKARSTAPAKHPIQKALLLTNLAALKNKQVAATTKLLGEEGVNERKTIRQAITTVQEALNAW